MLYTLLKFFSILFRVEYHHGTKLFITLLTVHYTEVIYVLNRHNLSYFNIIFPPKFQKHRTVELIFGTQPKGIYETLKVSYYISYIGNHYKNFVPTFLTIQNLT